MIKIITGDRTVYYYGVGEFDNQSGWNRTYIMLGDLKIAEYSWGTTYFFHHDHQGTPRYVTDVNGNVAETFDAYPFGEEWVHTGTTVSNDKYTGHYRDPESDNDYAGARHYSNSWGRWLSVDPVLGDMSNPQRLNRYSYILKDPIKSG